MIMSSPALHSFVRIIVIDFKLCMIILEAIEYNLGTEITILHYNGNFVGICVL